MVVDTGREDYQFIRVGAQKVEAAGMVVEGI